MDNNMDDLFYDNISVNPQKGILKQGENVLELTKNEMIIFTYLLSNRGRIVTRDDLMTDLWNNNEFINDNALTVNISRLRNKLQNFNIIGNSITKGLQLLQNYFFIYRNMYNYK